MEVRDWREGKEGRQEWNRNNELYGRNNVQ